MEAAMNNIVNQKNQVIAQVGQKRSLKHVETIDKSKPVIEKNLKIRKLDRSAFLSDIKKSHKLNHVHTVDKSKPRIQNVKIGKHSRLGWLSDIKNKVSTMVLGKDYSAQQKQVIASIPQKATLKHVETVDKSKPFIEKGMKIKKVNRAGLLTEIKSFHGLKHVTTVDKSMPVIENVKIRKHTRLSWLKDIKSKATNFVQGKHYVSQKNQVIASIPKKANLKHVETVDKSKPFIEKGMKIKKLDRSVLLNEIKAPHKLRHVITVDKSKPRLEHVKIRKSSKLWLNDIKTKVTGMLQGKNYVSMQKDVIASIPTKANLKHVETVDKSKPFIEKGMKIKKLDRSGLLNEIKSSHKLKHVTTVDKSKPVIEKVNLKRSTRRSWLYDIKSKVTNVIQGKTVTQQKKVFEEIPKKHTLKHADTVDKSKPLLDKNVHIKKVDRAGLLSEIQQPHSLNHAQTVDKSKPVIEKVKIHKTNKGWLSEIKHKVNDLKIALF